MNTYNIQIRTSNDEIVKLGQVKAENGWHAMNIAKKIGQKKGLTVVGMSSDLAWRESWGINPNA